MKKTELKNFLIKDFIFLAIIITIALALRLYKLNTPLADLHSWRQADTAAVARNFARNGFDLLHPKYDDLSSIQSGKENPQGLRMVEFPIFNAIFGYIYSIFPNYPVEIYGRLTSIFFSLIIISIIYYLCLKEEGRITAIFASLIFSVFPFFVFFSRAIFPETPALSFTFISIFFLYKWSKLNSKQIITAVFFFIFSIIFFALALLTKPTVIFYVITLFYIFIDKYHLSFIKKIPIYLFFLLSAIPFLLWRKYIQQYPEGIPASAWLIAYVNTFEGLKNIFFKPAFFRWIFFERINNIIFGGYLSFVFILGVISKTKKYLLHSILLSAFAYLFVFQGGNVQHEYYQIIILPALAIFSALGINFIAKNSKMFVYPIITWIIILFFLGFSLFFSFYKVRDYYNYPNDLIQIANIISSLTLKNDKIITDRMGDTTLLYLADRKGAPAQYKDLSDLKKDGYSYFVTANKENISSLRSAKKYQVIFENDQFVLFKL